jgi:hypothetical protein
MWRSGEGAGKKVDEGKEVWVRSEAVWVSVVHDPDFHNISSTGSTHLPYLSSPCEPRHALRMRGELPLPFYLCLWVFL